MKWTVADSTNKKFASNPSNVLKQTSSLFISAFIRYSMRKRKLGREENDHAARLNASFTESRKNSSRGIDSHQARRMISPLSKKELSILQIQLAMLSDVDGDKPIHIAVINEDILLVQKLCFMMCRNKLSLDVKNYLRQTPLHLAVIIGNVEIVQILLNFGASPRVCDRNGNSVLHLSVKTNTDKAVLPHLLSHYQVKDILDSLDYEGYPALHYAVFKNNVNAVKMLKDSGADMNKIDGKSGRTALIHAVLGQNVDMVELLLKSDACPQKTDYSGRSAFDMAVQIANMPIMKVLEKLVPDNGVTVVKENKPVNHHSAKNKRTIN